jgi:Fe2+ or Zn2+ uptake regulation protein
MAPQILETDKPERIICDYLYEKKKPITFTELYNQISREDPKMTQPRLKHAIMRLELYGLITTYERKEGELVLVPKE